MKKVIVIVCLVLIVAAFVFWGYKTYQKNNQPDNIETPVDEVEVMPEVVDEVGADAVEPVDPVPLPVD